MISKWRWIYLRLSGELWARAFLFSGLALVAVLAVPFADGLIPLGILDGVDTGATQRILEILATSMLSVTAFSMGAMVSAQTAAVANVTPRAAKLMLEDPSTQNALSAFVGSFLFALAGLIVLETGIHGDRGRAILFLVTVIVIILVVLTLLRWIDHLSRLGRLEHSASRLEDVIAAALTDRATSPSLGAKPFGSETPPSHAKPIYAERPGYVRYIDMVGLAGLAKTRGLIFWVVATPGCHVHAGRPLLLVEGNGDGKDGALIAGVRKAITTGAERSYAQDPRFGLAVLAEIASRALSPGVNDPGTAFDILGRSVRLLSEWAEEISRQEEAPILYDRLRFAPLSPRDLLEDIFLPLGRDGAGLVEVQRRTLKSLEAIALAGDGRFRAPAAELARMAVKRSERMLDLEEDREALRQSGIWVDRSV
ncbi:DUF2254 domain-containing protein [Rhodospirillum sp. A1_3_36]|uniref:DUF2254 domain-containing protein n=1 Tax=Rhodospirillum sp. A1_3_36 TaxID=3391666 RepID=UPI0039A44D20